MEPGASREIFRFYINRRHPIMVFETALRTLRRTMSLHKSVGEHYNRILEVVVLGVSYCTQYLAMVEHHKIKNLLFPRRERDYSPMMTPIEVLQRMLSALFRGG